jgi:hypothetical protein
MKELELQNKIRKRLSEHGRTVTWRNNVGTGWVGDVNRLTDGSILLKNPRPLHAGLCTGSSDLIGMTEVTITPDMVGKKIAVFTALEVKTKTGRATPDQMNFIHQVLKSGGIAGVVRSPEDAIQATKIRLK